MSYKSAVKNVIKVQTAHARFRPQGLWYKGFDGSRLLFIHKPLTFHLFIMLPSPFAFHYPCQVNKEKGQEDDDRKEDHRGDDERTVVVHPGVFYKCGNGFFADCLI